LGERDSTQFPSHPWEKPPLKIKVKSCWERRLPAGPFLEDFGMIPSKVMSDGCRLISGVEEITPWTFMDIYDAYCTKIIVAW